MSVYIGTALSAPIKPLPQSVKADWKKVPLVQKLFFDPHLSADGTVSCASCHDLENGGDDGLKYSVGVSGKKGNIILRTGIPADKIEVEITERFIMEYSTTNLTILEELRNIGCKISIDDFGTGYSSMSYLKSLAIDTIKIDKSFIMDLPHNSNDAEVSKAIIALSKSLGYEVIAEGIETEEQEAFLKEHGCDIGQGFYFAKPMPADDFIGFYKAHKQNKIKK